MHIGHYISGAAHAGVIGWALLGGAFRDDPPPFEVSGVSIVTTEQFEAALAAERAPQPEIDVTEPQAPTQTEEAPVLNSQTDDALPLETPQTAEASEPDATPTPPDYVPAPADITDEAPTMTPPTEEMAVLIPRDTVRPMERPTDRVAPEPVAPPEPDTAVDDVVKEATTPDDSVSETVAEPEEATAPEAATTEIVTEAKEQIALAPKASIRPVVRPASRPTTPAAQPQTTTDEPSTTSSTDAAVAEALAETAAAPSGPPLSQGDKDAIRVSVQKCWVVDVGSQASNVTVTVGFSLDREGKVSSGVELLSSEGGDSKAVDVAYQSARRAILRCQKGGYKLPIEKYDHWRDIEITFNPEKMRLK